MPSDEELEQEIQDKGLTAPRVTLGRIDAKVKDVEFVRHVTRSGSILRWAVLEMENGFTIAGKPSASVSAENDNAEIGERIATENAMNEVWAFEGYLLKEELYNLEPDDALGTDE